MNTARPLDGITSLKVKLGLLVAVGISTSREPQRYSPATSPLAAAIWW